MKIFLILVLTLTSFKTLSSNEQSCSGTWIYFDLGNTLVDTRDGSDKIRHMPGAKNYIKSLKNAGCKLGLIVNIPESFGANYEEKVTTLKNYVNKGWIERNPFAWDHFDEVYIPLNNTDRKPNTILFRLVHLNAWAKGKEVIYQGETPLEIESASSIGIKSFLVGSRSDTFYLPIEDILKEPL